MWVLGRGQGVQGLVDTTGFSPTVHLQAEESLQGGDGD